MAKKEDVPQSMRDSATIIGKKSHPDAVVQDTGPSFMGIPIGEDYVDGLITRVQVIRCDGENQTLYTNGPIIPEAGTLGLMQAFSIDDTGEVFESRCLVFIGAEVRIDQTLPPLWWSKVLKKDYVKANEGSPEQKKE